MSKNKTQPEAKSSVIATYYDSEKEAVEKAQKLNNRARKRNYIVLGEAGKWLVINVNQLL